MENPIPQPPVTCLNSLNHLHVLQAKKAYWHNKPTNQLNESVFFRLSAGKTWICFNKRPFGKAKVAKARKQSKQKWSKRGGVNKPEEANLGVWLSSSEWPHPALLPQSDLQTSTKPSKLPKGVLPDPTGIRRSACMRVWKKSGICVLYKWNMLNWW